jgi:endonuclease-8
MRPIGEVLMDQRVVAGVGNVYKSEVLFLEKVDPFDATGRLSKPTLRGIVERARELLRYNARPGAAAGRVTTVDTRTGDHLAPTQLWVYRRAGRPCHRCGTLIKSAPQGRDVPRTTYWCPHCQQPAG